MVNKSYIRTPKPDEQITVEPSIAMVKDLLEEDMDVVGDIPRGMTRPEV